MTITYLWMILLLHICFVFDEVLGFGINLIKVPVEDRATIACTIGLLGKYFRSGESLSGSVLHVTTTGAATHVQKSLLHAIHDDTEYPWSIVVNDARRKSGDVTKSWNFILHEKPQCYFVVIENIEDENMDAIFEIWKSTVNWNPLAQFVVFLSTVEETEEEMTDIMMEVLLIFMNKKIFNVNVIGQAEESNLIYGKTVFPYHPDNNCGNRVITVETLDTCDYHDDEDEEEEEEEEKEEGVEDVIEGEDGETQETNETGDQEDVNAVNSDERTEVQVQPEEEDTENGKSFEEPEGQTGVEKDPKEETTLIGKSLEEAYEPNEVTKEPEAEEAQSDENLEEHDEQNDVQNEPEAEERQSGISLEQPETNVTVNELEEKIQDVDNNSKKQLEDEISEASEFQETVKQNNKLPTKTPETEFEPISGTFSTEEASSTSQLSTTIPIEETQNLEAIQHFTTEVPGYETTSSSPLEKEFPKLDNTSAEKVPKFKSNFCSLETSAPQVQYLNGYNLKNSFYSHHKSLPLKEDEVPEKSKLYIEEMYPALFLNKFPRDLSGCPLVAAYRPWEPYIFNEASNDAREFGSNENSTMYNDEGVYEFKSYDDQPDWSEEDTENPVKIRLNGIEYKLIQTIGERLHISINMQVENTNVYQLFQQLIDGDIEMVIGGIDEDPIISQYVSSTIPYYQDDLTWCVAKARRSYSLFSFMATFEPRGWILLLFFIHAASLSIRMAQRLLKFHIKSLKTYFAVSIYVMGTILSQSLNLRSLPISLKISFGTIFFMSLMFNNVYQSILVSTLTTPKSSYQISHTQEIYANRMHVMGSVDNVRHLNKDGEIFRYVREQFQMCYNIEECLRRTALDATLAVAVSRLHSFYNPRIPRDHLYCFDRNENIYVYLVTMLLPKKFHLLHKINPIIQHIIESGHMQKWARDLDMRRKITEAINRAHEDKFKSLTLGQVIGPFALNGFLLANASLVFALERTAFWLVVRRRTRLKIAKYLHRKFY